MPNLQRKVHSREPGLSMDRNQIQQLALQLGFTACVPLNTASLEFRPEVREMCASGRCGNYNKSWSCPPACGSLEEIREKASAFSDGIIVQTTAQLEDSFDYEGMMDAAARHGASFEKLAEALRQDGLIFLPMGAGGCRVCQSCTYPDAPCRFPEKRMTSMEAYGLVVSDVCKNSNVPYYYGPNTLTYVSCILF